ncbi:hypothetical protein [Pectobacterium versatile]|uniref:hypothetical protein n=1 Tax=Pectobacterium versatile TaxID=2488639 RepID=UPI001F40EB8C|nr:hypothetical protein [Pectobacterium versatile]
MNELHESYRIALSKMKELHDMELSGSVSQMSKEDLRQFRIEIASRVSDVRFIWCCLAQMESNIKDVTEDELFEFIKLSQDENKVFLTMPH